MQNFYNKINSTAVLLVLIMIGCAPLKPLIYQQDATQFLSDFKPALCLPAYHVSVQLAGNVPMKPDARFSDSLYIEAASSFLTFQSARYFTVKNFDDDSPDFDTSQLATLSKITYSPLKNDTMHKTEVSEIFRRIAAENSVEYVVYPRHIAIRYVAVQQKTWRSTGPSYERPVSYNAYCTVEVQIWDANGVLRLETIGKGNAGRPVLYNWFGKNKPELDMIHYARRLFASPMVRVLFNAMQNALQLGC